MGKEEEEEEGKKEEGKEGKKIIHPAPNSIHLSILMGDTMYSLAVNRLLASCITGEISCTSLVVSLLQLAASVTGVDLTNRLTALEPPRRSASSSSSSSSSSSPF